MRRPLLCGLVLALALSTAVGAAGAGAESRRVAAEPAPVASLEPAATEALWQRLTANPPRAIRQQAACRPLRAVFYAATDYLRLATKLAANASPCAEYYISVPPLVADKTKPRPGAAEKIRALGPIFHSLAEFHFATWTKWVASTGSSWFVAGQTARERMTAAGYDFTKGDSWVLNEVTSAIRKNTGQARTNLRDLLRGLYEGDGTRPTRGAAFVVGLGQQTGDLGLYQSNLQSWLTDSSFWADMSTYVSDWTQEAYGDVRSWAVPGADPTTRRDYLNDYLQHPLVLAGAGPSTIDTARAYLQSAYTSLGNAAWERDTAYGWTAVPVAQMDAYVSSQVHAMRYFGVATGRATDRFGFAWAPRNGSNTSTGDFAAQTGEILDRLAAAIRDSGQVDPEDPGSAACGATLCAGDLAGARFNEAWKTLRVWSQPALSFATAPQTVPAGTPTAAIRLSLLSSAGQPTTATAPLAIAMSSRSPAGTFSTSPTGPWTPTLALSIAAGTGTSGDFYYLDTRAGAQLLTAAAQGVTSGTQTVTVTAGPLAAITVTPPAGTLRARGTLPLAASGRDTYGNTLPVAPAWSLTPPSAGKVTPRTGSATTLTAFRATGAITVTAAAGPIAGSAVLQVQPDRLRISSLAYRPRPGAALLSLRAVDSAGRPVSAAKVAVLVRRDGRRYVSRSAATGAAGKTVFRIPLRRGGCLTTALRRVTAVGFVWDGRTPRNRYCRPAP